MKYGISSYKVKEVASGIGMGMLVMLTCLVCVALCRLNCALHLINTLLCFFIIIFDISHIDRVPTPPGKSWKIFLKIMHFFHQLRWKSFFFCSLHSQITC